MAFSPRDVELMRVLGAYNASHPWPPSPRAEDAPVAEPAFDRDMRQIFDPYDIEAQLQDDQEEYQRKVETPATIRRSITVFPQTPMSVQPAARTRGARHESATQPEWAEFEWGRDMGVEDMRVLCTFRSIMTHRKDICVFVGAGVSVAAGIETFEGQGSRPAEEMKLFTHANLTSSDKKARQLFAALDAIRQRSKPRRSNSNKTYTVFHRMLHRVWASGRVARLYTQNFDGLDIANGTCVLDDYLKEGDVDDLPIVCPLNGSVHLLCCWTCGYVEKDQSRVDECYTSMRRDGSTLPCKECNKRLSRRRSTGELQPSGGTLVPRVLLQGAPVPKFDSTVRTRIENADNKPRRFDAFLIVGTSLAQRDVESLIMKLIKAAQTDGGNPEVIWINTAQPPTSLRPYLTLVMIGDAEYVASYTFVTGSRNIEFGMS